jgi:hypothetical protein
VADGTLQILVLGTSAVPLDYTVSGSRELDLVAVKADFNGAAAAVAFVPMVEIVSDAGVVMASGQGATVAAGGSATVTFAPFLDDGTGSGSGGTGLQFDTDPQAGGWFEMQTTSSGAAPSGWGIQLADTGGDGIQLQSPAGGVDIRGAGLNVVSTSDIALTSSGGSIRLDGSTAPSDITVTIPAGHQLAVQLATLAKIFEVRGDGTIHGKASVGAITWDL